MECRPPLRDEVVKDAVPPKTATVASAADPSRNCTFPVACPAEGGPPPTETVAVNVTVCPGTLGLTLLVMLIEDVAGAFTVAEDGLMLPLKLESRGTTAEN